MTRHTFYPFTFTVTFNVVECLIFVEITYIIADRSSPFITSLYFDLSIEEKLEEKNAQPSVLNAYRKLQLYL